MFDPQMLMSMLGGMNNNMNNIGQNFVGDNANNTNGDMFSSMLQNPAMLSGLMQMISGNSQNNQGQNQTGNTTYVNNKVSSQDVNRDLYNILKNADKL